MRALGLGDNVIDKYENLHKGYPGGNSLNFAVFSKKLGAYAGFMGVFGTDKEANHVKKVISELGIDNSHSRQVDGENGWSAVNIINGDRVFLGSNDGGVTRLFPIQLNDDDCDYIQSFDIVHMGLYSHVNHLLDNIKKLPIILSYDFSDNFKQNDIDEVIKNVDFGFFSRSDFSENEAKKFLKKQFHSNNKVLLMTRGNKSAIAFDGVNFCATSPKIIDPVDTMAAGDSFITAFLFNYLEMKNGIKESMLKAHDFASESCLVEGSFGYGEEYY